MHEKSFIVIPDRRLRLGRSKEHSATPSSQRTRSIASVPRRWKETWWVLERHKWADASMTSQRCPRVTISPSCGRFAWGTNGIFNLMVYLINVVSPCCQPFHGISNVVSPWKVKVTDGVPALISPVKPKYYIKSVTTLPAKTAMKVQ